MQEVKIGVFKMYQDVELPSYARYGDAGADVKSYMPDKIPVLLKGGETVAIGTGLKLDIPTGYQVSVRPRSGMSLKTKLRVSNSPGTIDAGYKDEVRIIITNTGDNYVTIEHGTKIAQLVVEPVIFGNYIQDYKNEDSPEDRGGGFDSTGGTEKVIIH